MKSVQSLICLTLLLGSLFFEPAGEASAQTAPNVIFVLADDLGIGDITPTNPDCKIKTPNLQQMADEGLTFLDAHSPSAVCTPTRYSVLTGRYNWRSRMKKGVLSGRSKHLIPAERATVAHLLKKASYNTQMIGKWHLGWDWTMKPGTKKIDFSKSVVNGPDINGFDHYYGHCGSLDMAPYVWVDTGKPTSVPEGTAGVSREEDPYGWYRKGPIGADFKIDEVLPHLFQKSITFIKEQAELQSSENGEAKPFFLYLPLPAPHTPIVPVPPFKDASKMNPYADFVMQTDHHMGELFAALKEAGVDENTIVFFTSDNGCSPEANFEVLKEFDHDPSASFRGNKADLYEGGHRVPLVVRWPQGIKGGQKTSALACLTDFYATMRELTAQKPEDNAGEDSFSLLPIMKGDADTSGRTTLVSHSISGHFAIRSGAWKLCLSAGSAGWSDPREAAAKKQDLPPMQLFNLDSDPAEEENLLEKHPEQVEFLMNLLEKQVADGRCTAGNPVSNDGEVTILRNGRKRAKK